MNKIEQIRALLEANPDGLTTIEIVEAMGNTTRQYVIKCCHKMPDVYVDRWVMSRQAQAWAMVWALGYFEDAPMPSINPVIYGQAERERRHYA